MSSESEKPHLSSEYYKARKNYNLFAGLFFLWEFVGIELPKNPWGNMNITFKSPEAAPYVLLFILFFYAFRITVEWLQSDVSRRLLIQSKLDFYFSHAIAFISISIFFIQVAIHEQIFIKFPISNIVSVLVVVLFLLWVIYKYLLMMMDLLKTYKNMGTSVKRYRVTQILVILSILIIFPVDVLVVMYSPVVLNLYSENRLINELLCSAYFIIALLIIATLMMLPQVYIKRQLSKKSTIKL